MPKHFDSLNGLKRAAKKWKREKGISHSAALEAVSREAGFPNYFTAEASFTARAIAVAPPRPRNFVTISEAWFDRHNRVRGTETRVFEIDKPLTELVRPHHLTGYLSGCTFGGPDTIIGYGHNDSKDEARFEVCRIARTLQFMAATGLRPSNARRCYPRGKWDNRPPGSDHDHGWYHPKTGGYILTEEPYSGHFKSFAEERKAWGAKHGWRSVRSRWGCIYGHGTELHLTGVAKGGVSLAGLARRLASLSPPYDETDWPEDRPLASTRAAAMRSSDKSDALLAPVEILEMPAELSERLRRLREIEIAEAGPQAPEPTIDYLGVTLTSRWGIARELETMRAIVDAMPEGVQDRVESMWCDSNCQAYYTVTIAPNRWVDGIELVVREAVLDVTDGFNGLLVESAGRQELFDPEWLGDDYLDDIEEPVQ